MTLRVGAIDCGTNALRLLIADVDIPGVDIPGVGPASGAEGAGRLDAVQRRAEIVRLGEGVEASGEISSEAMGRALAVIARYGALCREARVDAVRVVATSAMRDARNAGQFADAVTDVLGVRPVVVSGEREARLSFLGATRGRPGNLASPCVVVDLGGGSTEFIVGVPRTGEILGARSVDIGSGRLTERYLTPPGAGAPAAAGAVGGLLADVASHLPWAFGVAGTRTVIGTGGTVLTIAAHVLHEAGLGLAHPRDLLIGRLDGQFLDPVAVRAACADLMARPAKALASLPYVQPGRAAVMRGGALLWDQIMLHTLGDVAEPVLMVSEHDILDGIAWEMGEGSVR